MSEWIKCSDRMPDDNIRIAVLFRGVTNIGYIHRSNNGGWFWCVLGLSNQWQKKDAVTHWMPLPEPPKENR